jgi:hypothetical protein
MPKPINRADTSNSRYEKSLNDQRLEKEKVRIM